MDDWRNALVASGQILPHEEACFAVSRKLFERAPAAESVLRAGRPGEWRVIVREDAQAVLDNLEGE
jgi:hypothetical protein